MNMTTSDGILLGKQIVFISETVQPPTACRAAFERCGAVVEYISGTAAARRVLLARDIDMVVLSSEVVESDGLAFLRETFRLWPWLVVTVTGNRISPALRRSLEPLGVSFLAPEAADFVNLLVHARKQLERRQSKLVSQGLAGLSDCRYPLYLLRRMTEPALISGNFTTALRELANGIATWAPSAVVAILGIEEGAPALVVEAAEPITQAFVDDLRQRLLHDYEELTGTSLAPYLRVVHDGQTVAERGLANVGRSFSVPMVAEGKTVGVLLLATTATTIPDQLVGFVYHAANHFGTVFSALLAVRRQATRDPVTKLYNRYHLEQEYHSLAKRCRRHHPMSVVIIDIDHFKAVNDTYGHPVGDQLLGEFATVLLKATRSSDIVGRYGGEEFVVLLPQGDLQEAISYADRVRKFVRDHRFCPGLYDIKITVSCGVANGNPWGACGRDSPSLFSQADTAMYEAKKAGRNCIRVWSPELLPKRAKPPPSGTAFQELAQKSKGSRVLVVDDDPEVSRVVCKALMMEGYDPGTAFSGEEAIDLISNAPYVYDLLLVDLQLPGIDGLEVIRHANRLDNSILSVVITGNATAEAAINSLREGVYDLIQKPVRLVQLITTVQRALEYRKALLENRKYQQHLSEMIRQKSTRLNESLEEIKLSYEYTLESLANLLDLREKDYGQHSKRVRELTELLARQMGLGVAAAEKVGQGALLHDIGKIGVPDSILLKPGPLDDEEWQVMRKHPEIGYSILETSPYLGEVAEIVYSHHERYDGKGYPRRIAGDYICLGARIFSVVDAYDAMRSNRIYRQAKSPASALTEIQAESGTQFDPQVVEAFTNCQAEIEQRFLASRPPTGLTGDCPLHAQAADQR